MAGRKIAVEFKIPKDLDQMLEYATEKYALEDKSKALRCILDFTATDADWDVIFNQKRCLRCGPGGWTREKHESK
ncbi:hypothetical protein UZ36_02740 [Candidatus Nitromaritima sp. SCGC AAA799-C22]|nr:hypothetical protein UZ36_02740 [Candidatus Nitromaritima sp. SCGC AAA799-C22]